MTMDAPAPQASASLKPKWTDHNGATVPLGASSGKPIVDRARALITFPHCFLCQSGGLDVPGQDASANFRCLPASSWEFMLSNELRHGRLELDCR